MISKFKAELEGNVVRCYYWEKYWWIFGQWIPYSNKAFGSVYDAFIEYDKICKLINPSFKHNFN